MFSTPSPPLMTKFDDSAEVIWVEPCASGELGDLGGVEPALAVLDVRVDDADRIGAVALVAVKARTGDDDRGFVSLRGLRIGSAALRRAGPKLTLVRVGVDLRGGIGASLLRGGVGDVGAALRDRRARGLRGSGLRRAGLAQTAPSAITDAESENREAGDKSRILRGPLRVDRSDPSSIRSVATERLNGR